MKRKNDKERQYSSRTIKEFVGQPPPLTTQKAIPMTKRKSKPTSPTVWIDTLDLDEIAAACEEATVDACDEYEQAMGLVTMVQESLEFPFAAKVLGQTVQVITADTSKMDSRGIDLIVEFDGKQYPVAAGSVELAQPLPTGAVYLAAHLDWKRRF